MAGDRSGLGRDAFHHVAVAAEDIDIIVEKRGVWLVEARAQPAAGDGHADTIAAALAQRPSGGLDAGGHAVFRMARGLGIQLAEGFDVVEADGGLARLFAVGVDFADTGHVQKAVEQHRGVTARQDETVAVRPVGPVWIVAQEARPQRIGGRRQAHRRARVTGLGLFDRVHGQGAYGVDAEGIQVRGAHALVVAGHRPDCVRVCHGLSASQLDLKTARLSRRRHKETIAKNWAKNWT